MGYAWYSLVLRAEMQTRFLDIHPSSRLGGNIRTERPRVESNDGTMMGVCQCHHPTAARAGKSSPVRPNAEKTKKIKE